MYSHRVPWRRGRRSGGITSRSKRDAASALRVEALETRELLAVAVTTGLTGTEKVPLSGQIATFSSTDVQGTDPQATIVWGDGQTTTGTVIINAGNDAVYGAHVYAVPGIYPVTVTVTGTESSTATGQGQATIAPALSGHLDPLSDTGASNTDGITAINQPTFVGTAAPYAVVQLSVRRSDQAQTVLLGQAIANTSGAWNFTVGALPDGVYSISVTETPSTGFPTAMISAGQVVIDTKSPRVKSATVDRASGQVVIVFRDSLSGLNPLTLTERANYTIVGHPGPRMRPSDVTVVPISSVVPSNTVAVRLRFNVHPEDLAGRTVAVGGITDLAGNPLGHGSARLTPVGHGGPDARHAFRLAARAHHGMHRR